MENKKQEELEKMYALRAGLSVISQKIDEVDYIRKNLKKMQLSTQEIKELCYYLYYGYTDNVKDPYNGGDRKYYDEVKSSTYYDDITLYFEEFMFDKTGTLLGYVDLEKDYKEYTSKSWLAKRKFKEKITFCEQAMKKNQNTLEELKVQYREKEKELKQIAKKTKEETPILEQIIYNLSTKLTETYDTILDIRDWENLDLVIYYYETGRADSIKEALQLVDKERRNNALIEAIGIATNEICRSIHSLGDVMIAGFNSLSAQMEAQRIQTMGALQQLNNNLSGVITQQTLSNALLAKANVSSKDMVEQMKKLNSKIK